MTTIKDLIRDRCTKYGISLPKLEEQLGFGAGTISKWDKSTPSLDKIIKVADFFNIYIDDLIGRKLSTNPHFNARDERDIQKTLSRTLETLNSGEALMFDGEPINEETNELLKASLENSLRVGKALAKKKYTPKKYRLNQEE